MATLASDRAVAVAAFVARAASLPRAPLPRAPRAPQLPEADERHPERRALIAAGRLVPAGAVSSGASLRRQLIAAGALRPAR
jgi:hypothetical protein